MLVQKYLKLREEKSFGTLLTYDMDNDENIIEVFYDYNDTLPSELVPFAFDPAGNLICFDYKIMKKIQLSSFGNMRGMGKGNIDGK